MLCRPLPEVSEKGGDGGEEKAVVPLGLGGGDLVQQFLHGERFGYTATLQVLDTRGRNNCISVIKHTFLENHLLISFLAKLEPRGMNAADGHVTVKVPLFV